MHRVTHALAVCHAQAASGQLHDEVLALLQQLVELGISTQAPDSELGQLLDAFNQALAGMGDGAGAAAAGAGGWAASTSAAAGQPGAGAGGSAAGGAVLLAASSWQAGLGWQDPIPSWAVPSVSARQYPSGSGGPGEALLL